MPLRTTSPVVTAAAPLVRDDKLVIRGRIKDAASARSLYEMMWDSDRIASQNRARVQSMIDGAPPKNQNMELLNAGIDTNINWGDGERILHEECAPYFDMIFSNEVFGTCPMKLDYMEASIREEHESTIAEEITGLLRNWDMFAPLRMQSILEFKTHGLSFDYHDDDDCWPWRTAGLQYFKLPRPCPIGVDNIPYCAVRVELSPEELYAKIKDPELATAAGWNVPEVKKVIMRAAPVTGQSTDWEFWERYWKDNDYMMAYETRVCPCIFFFSKELDGTVSQYLMPEDGGDFMYKKLGKYSRMGGFVHIYMDNVGTNKFYHSIRGTAHKIYATVQELNRKINSFSDLVDFASTPMFQPDSDVDIDEEATSQAGGYLVLNPRWKMPTTQIPNYKDSLIPALSMFGERLRSRTSRISSANRYLSPDGKTPKHMFEAQLEEAKQLNDASLELYLNSWRGQWKEIVRRICRKNYLPAEPGGKQVAELKKRLYERGIKDPDQALGAVDWRRCEVERGLGAGSAAARILILDRIEPEVARMDPVAQETFLRMKVMAIGGVQLANKLTPNKGGNRLPVDASIADLQNNEIMKGEQVPVREGQNHVVTAAVRLQKLQELNQMVSEGGNAALMQLALPMHNLLVDLEKHLEMANQDDPQVRSMTKMAQQFNEIATNGLKQAQAMQERAAREAEHNGAASMHNPQGDGEGGAQGGQPQEDHSKAVEASIRLQEKMSNLQYIQAKHQQELIQSQRKFEQDTKLADLKAAADIRRKGL